MAILNFLLTAQLRAKVAEDAMQTVIIKKEGKTKAFSRRKKTPMKQRLSSGSIPPQLISIHRWSLPIKTNGIQKQKITKEPNRLFSNWICFRLDQRKSILIQNLRKF